MGVLSGAEGDALADSPSLAPGGLATLVRLTPVLSRALGAADISPSLLGLNVSATRSLAGIVLSANMCEDSVNMVHTYPFRTFLVKALEIYRSFPVYEYPGSITIMCRVGRVPALRNHVILSSWANLAQKCLISKLMSLLC
jgi:hypothetical protein